MKKQNFRNNVDFMTFVIYGAFDNNLCILDLEYSPMHDACYTGLNL